MKRQPTTPEPAALAPAAAPPLWAGCGVRAWWRLLARNRFAVRRSRWKRAAVVTASSAVQSALGFMQRAVYGDLVAGAAPHRPPLFILGHWRTGTTLLHELLACDPRHAAPTTYDCFNPHHFLLTRNWLPVLLPRLVPVRRPMDAMAAGWWRPQEDEFALALLGQPSPYERIAFPNGPGPAAPLDPREVPEPVRASWERALRRFVQALTLARGGRRLVLKSPPHTARVPSLLRLFPEAKFIHLARDPYAVYSSTLNLWRVLFTAHGMQPPSWEALPECVLDSFSRLHRAFEDARGLIPTGHLYELRYEDLVRNPAGHLTAAYRSLELGDFGPARRPVGEHLARVRGHEPNPHSLTPGERLAVNDRWADYFHRHGYAVQPP